MTMKPDSTTNADLSQQELEALRRFDTCTLSNAIERLNIRPRNEGFITGPVTCRFPQLAPVIGYAVTARMRSCSLPISGRCYHEHPEFWRYVNSLAGPRIVVIQDADDSTGFGSLFGEIHARISRALGCVACVTNGAVRDLPGVEALGFQLFAGAVSVSHAYAHVVDFGEPVRIGGLQICSGDLLHGDLHGVHTIPIGAARELPGVAEQVLREDRELFELTSRKDFSVELLAAKFQQAVDGCQ
jgi:4-hydroxy-4-methyl-2-oxoglutarate aldolase